MSTPGSFGEACGSCGGTINCSSDCTVSTPGNFGEACGSCGGTVACDSSCSIPTPSSYGQSCGSCGGTINCSSDCSISTPANYGQTCNSCGATYDCAGDCNGPAPTGLNSGDLGTFDLDFNSGAGCSDGVLYSWYPPISNPNPSGTYSCNYTFTNENNLGDTSGDDVLVIGCENDPLYTGTTYNEEQLQNGGTSFSGSVTCPANDSVTAFVIVCDRSGGCCGDPGIHIDVTGCSSTDAICQ